MHNFFLTSITVRLNLLSWRITVPTLFSFSSVSTTKNCNASGEQIEFDSDDCEKNFVRLRVFRALDGHSDESAPYNPC